jgi:predicted RNase H-like HicB family nuclease
MRSRSAASTTRTLGGVTRVHEIEFVFEPQEEGGRDAYAPELPGLHSEGDSLDDAAENVREAVALYVEGLREDGRSPDLLL